MASYILSLFCTLLHFKGALNLTNGSQAVFLKFIKVLYLRIQHPNEIVCLELTRFDSVYYILHCFFFCFFLFFVFVFRKSQVIDSNFHILKMQKVVLCFPKLKASEIFINILRNLFLLMAIFHISRSYFSNYEKQQYFEFLLIIN